MTTTEEIAALEARIKAEHFDELYRAMQGAGHEVGFDASPETSARRQTAHELRDTTNERRWLVRRHNGGLHETKLPGCPYCYPPGPRGDHRP